MTQVARRIEGTSALKLEGQASSFHEEVVESEATLQPCAATQVDAGAQEAPYLGDDLRIIWEASGLPDMMYELKEGSIAGDPLDVGWPAILAGAAISLILTIIMFC